MEQQHTGSISSLEAQGQAAAHNSNSDNLNSVNSNSAYVWNQFESDHVPISVISVCQHRSRRQHRSRCCSGSVASTGACTEKASQRKD